MNNFLDKLIPFNHLFDSSEKTLTAWWVLITLLIFLVYSFWLLIVVRKINKEIQSIKNKEFDDLKYLNDLSQDYERELFDYRSIRKTYSNAIEFFNDSTVFSKNGIIKFCLFLPGILVGIGILGTFVGLTSGISGFDTGSTPKIQNSIKNLLSGMGTAFVSSIWGMALSILFTVIEKWQLNSVSKNLSDLYMKLDRDHHITRIEEETINFDKNTNLLRNLFIFKNDKGHDVVPANVFRDIYEESIKQSQALQSFSTDLAFTIEAGFNKILGEKINNDIAPLINQLAQEIQKLGSSLKDPASDMTKSIVEDLRTAMSSMIGEFQKSVTGNTKSEMENLALMLNNAGSALANFPDKFEELTNNINENMLSTKNIFENISTNALQQSQTATDQMADQMSKTANAFENKIRELQENQQNLMTRQEESIEAVKTAIESIGKNVSEQNSETILQTKNQFKSISDIVTNSIADLQAGMEILLNKQTENAKFSENLSVSFNATIFKMGETLKEAEKTFSKFNTVQSDLNILSNNVLKTSDNINSSGQIFRKAQIDFTNQLNEINLKYSSNIKELQNSLDQAKNVSKDYAEKFSIIEKGLQSIFGEIQKGLTEYTRTINKGVSENLNSFTNGFTKMAESLESSIGKQSELLEEISDSIEKIKR